MNLRTELMPHQIDAMNKVLPTRIGALFMEMGTGKSRTAIELVSRRLDKIDRVIWFCPVSLKETVRQEILKHTDCAPADIHVFNSRTNDRNTPCAWWYVVGIESMSSSARVVHAVNKLVTTMSMVILDESSYIKGHNSMRTQRITHICQRARYRLILTGTPLSQGVVDLFAQMRFLSPKILGYNSFYSFAANHLEYSEKYHGMIVRAHNVPYLAAKIAPYTYQVTKGECLSLPDKLHTARYFYMTSEQAYYYERVKDDILSEIDDHDDWGASLAIFRLFSYLQQITCGFCNRWKEPVKFEHHRLDMLRDVIDSIPPDERVIIWCKYRHDIEQIKCVLGSDIALFYGDLSERRRTEEVQKFRQGARFFLSTQQCGGHGLTLNEAHHVIFYNNAFKYSERLQAEDRCHRIGQQHKVTYIDIHCVDSIDDRISEALAKKGSVVSAFRDEVEKVKSQKNALKELIKSL